MATEPEHPSGHRIWLGRQREVRELEAGLADLRAGRGGLYLITGEPGIGKTRLADETGRSAAARGLSVHWGRAWEVGGAPSYWPFIQVLRSICSGLDQAALGGALDRVHAAEIAELIPEIRTRIPGLQMQAPVQATRDRFQLFDAVGAFLRVAAERAPRLVVLDDLHAADPSTLLLLQFLVRDLRSGPLMVVGTFREAEARLAPEIGRTLAQVSREACLLPLRRLDRGEVADFVTLATREPPTAERIATIHQRTEGNPLFLRELLRLDGAAVARQPEGIREVVRARLALLTPVVRQALEAAAVLGREFGIAPLAALLEAPEAEVAVWLAPASDAGIVEALDGGASRWRFTHVLLREGLYQDLPADRRASWHRDAAADLRRRGGERLTELAHHLLHAVPLVEAAEAADAAVRAAVQAMDLLAFEDAVALLGRTIDLLEATGGEQRRAAEALIGRGVARIRAGEIDLGKRDCRRGAELARGLGDGDLFARAALGCAYEFTPGIRDTALIALLEEALAMLPSGDGALRARCMVQLAAERQPEPDTRPPVELARAAVEMARRLGDAETLRFALPTAAMAMLGFADVHQRLANNQEALRLGLAAGDRMVVMRAHQCLAADYWELGDRVGAEAHIRAYTAVVKDFRRGRFHWTPIAMSAATALWEGQFDEAERLYQLADQLSREDQSRGGSMVAFPVHFCRAAERYDDLPGLEARLRAAFGSMPHQLGGCIGEMFITQLHARAGDRQRTASQLAVVRAFPVFAEIQEPSWLGLLAEPCHLLGDVELAERLHAALLPKAGRFFNLVPLGLCEPPYDRQLGLLAQTLGRFDEAVTRLAVAEALVVRAGMRSHLARLRYELAGALLARDGSGDRARAASLLAQSAQVAAELGQAALLPLITARTGEAPAPAESPRAPSFALRPEGDYWTVVYGARTLRLRDSRGMQVLAELVGSPGQEFHVLQLVSPADEGGDPGDAGTVLDAEAVQSYRRRLLDLRDQLEEAEARADAGHAEVAREEMERLTQELARAVGLGGRARRSGGAAERARTAVQKRLRGAIRRIGEELPELGRHLDQTIHTGSFCGYHPAGRRRS